MKNLLFLPLLLLSCFLSAQTVITGKVADEKGEPLIGANIFLENTYDGTSSDVEGKLSFKTSESGKKLLRVETIGYKKQQQEILLNTGTISLDFILEEEFNELKAVPLGEPGMMTPLLLTVE